MDVDDAVDTVMNTTLMEDAARDFGMSQISVYSSKKYSKF